VYIKVGLFGLVIHQHQKYIGKGQDETMTATLSHKQVVRTPVAENRTVIILYGSETGNAEEIAMALGKMAERLHFQTRVDEMDGFKLVSYETLSSFPASETDS
jgi:sulfite reductase alpha subunit-like flavoprotein